MQGFEKKRNVIFELMDVLTNREKIREYLDEKIINDNDLATYFDIIKELDVIMEFDDFKETAPLVYGQNFNYESFLYVMFHQENYKYNKQDFKK